MDDGEVDSLTVGGRGGGQFGGLSVCRTEKKNEIVITEKKIAIGVIDHHTLQVERPGQVAKLIREALKHIPAERLIISSDCGMGREGMTRRHANYKMIAMVQGTNIVRRELGLSEAEVRAADPGLAFGWPEG